MKRKGPREVTYLTVESKTDTSLNIAWNNTYNNKCTTNYNVTWINLETSQVKYSINSANKLYHNITGLKACTLYQYDVDTLADLGQHSGQTGRISKTDGCPFTQYIARKNFSPAAEIESEEDEAQLKTFI
uniref:Fibronectin type-III domain-containing protein n=1 Tax=Timema cristinae TaxID=61476 RepID=A0A7R9H2L1_TIMCR|nr:unnamed protein product [Timema cristinae]